MLGFHGQPRAVARKRNATDTEPGDDMENARPAKRKVACAKATVFSFEQDDEPQDNVYTHTPTPDLYSPMEIDKHPDDFAESIPMLPETDESEGSDDELCRLMVNFSHEDSSQLVHALLDRPCAPVAKEQAPHTRSFSAITVGYEADNEDASLSGDSMDY